ncbi:uncharacterized protein Bfra_002278 [Botrytis fragariae]|uniref:Uncharacterized protein n=1 Tax=Botrytis fragariae TaxID=1964551 RepID=A0A8H6EKS5_9HELO|nr:uncharacterized protein Bfra_002278 [Botrytis fragariae]KAF5875882.1 hypothetical protein Bfra_002278 [Botrytis fragariae]
MHTQTLYTYALVALASSVLAAPVGISGTVASTSVSKNLVAREPFVVYGKSFEEESAVSFEKERRVDGFALPVSKTPVISRGNEGSSGSPPSGQSSGSNNGNGNGNKPPPGPRPSNGPSNSGGLLLDRHLRRVDREIADRMEMDMDLLLHRTDREIADRMRGPPPGSPPSSSGPGNSGSNGNGYGPPPSSSGPGGSGPGNSGSNGNGSSGSSNGQSNNGPSGSNDPSSGGPSGGRMDLRMETVHRDRRMDRRMEDQVEDRAEISIKEPI